MPAQEVFIRNSERSRFKDCRQAWWWSYVDCLKSLNEKTALQYGTLAHRVLELRYPPGTKRGPKPAFLAKKVWKQYLADGGDEFSLKLSKTEPVPADEMLVEMFTNYYDEYGDDERYKVISAEQVFQIDVFHPKTGKYMFTWVGTIDGIWYDLWEKQYLFAEHKTGGTLDPFGAPIYLDEQQASYWALGYQWAVATGLIPAKAPMKGVLYNRLRKAFADTRPQDENGHRLNKDGTKSKNQPTPLFKRELVYRTPEERAGTIRSIMNEAREMKMVRSGRLAVYKRPDKHCTYCEFRDMCEVHESGGDWLAMKDGLYKNWDPYDAHHLTLEEEEVA